MWRNCHNVCDYASGSLSDRKGAWTCLTAGVGVFVRPGPANGMSWCRGFCRGPVYAGESGRLRPWAWCRLQTYFLLVPYQLSVDVVSGHHPVLPYQRDNGRGYAERPPYTGIFKARAPDPYIYNIHPCTISSVESAPVHRVYHGVLADTMSTTSSPHSPHQSWKN